MATRAEPTVLLDGSCSKVAPGNGRIRAARVDAPGAAWQSAEP